MILHLNNAEKGVNYDSTEQRALIIEAFLQKFPAWTPLLNQATSIESLGFLEVSLPWTDIKLVLTNLVVDIEIKYNQILIRSFYPSEEVYRFGFSALPVVKNINYIHNRYNLALRPDLYAHEQIYWSHKGEPLDIFRYNADAEDPALMWQRQLDLINKVVSQDIQEPYVSYYELTYSS